MGIYDRLPTTLREHLRETITSYEIQEKKMQQKTNHSNIHIVYMVC